MLPTEYQTFIAKSRYARWLEDEGRRENWNETVERYLSFFDEQTDRLVSKGQGKFRLGKEKTLRSELSDVINNLEAMPSMRALMTAGPALVRDNVAGYNCAYLPIDNIRAFDEILYILMCGTGVGFSVERRYVDQLPEVPTLDSTTTQIVVEDSKIGLAKALRALFISLYSGDVPKVDTSGLRPAGARLKTFGGRSSGPIPLENAIEFIKLAFHNAQGRRLTDLECHDIVCVIAKAVVSGGVRRSALISLSNLSSDAMRLAKSGSWYDVNPQRSLANNSVVYTRKPDIGAFMSEWVSLYESKSGERGFFNRQAAVTQVERTGRRDPDYDWGTNPCSEIILRPNEFCNLSEIVVRERDSEAELTAKAEFATILGTLQSTLTDFRYLRKRWADNCNEERLLGVSLTGILDNPLTYDPDCDMLTRMKEATVACNVRYAKMLDIPQAAAITCVKPSGTASQLVDSASGIHARHAPYYIRNVQGSNNDPMTKFLQDQGIPSEPYYMAPDDTTVFSFPQKAPDNCVVNADMTAIEHLDLWKKYQDYWCEHKPSVTISVREHEWMRVGSWCYDNFDAMSGVSFLPLDDHVYRQAPYTECTKEDYDKAKAGMPVVIDWAKLSEYEETDNTASSQTLACTGSSCEIVDIGG